MPDTNFNSVRAANVDLAALAGLVDNLKIVDMDSLEPELSKFFESYMLHQDLDRERKDEAYLAYKSLLNIVQKLKVCIAA